MTAQERQPHDHPQIFPADSSGVLMVVAVRYIFVQRPTQRAFAK
jgi:hypothetical protein